jgi:hypothetical protein
MGKSDEKQTKKRARKATDGGSKHKNKPSVDAATFEATDDEGLRHSHWRDQFRQLCEYKVQFGHCTVPARYSANPKLGNWVSSQRGQSKLFQEGKPSPMTDERIRALEGIGFDWGTTTTDLESIWSARFQQLCEYKIQIGHCLVPYQYSANPKLGNWVSTQRTMYRLQREGKPSPMTEERIRSLEGIGFDWGTTTTDLESIWSARFQQLCEYKIQIGHCLVPYLYSANPKLGRWVSTQRRTYRLYQEGKTSAMTEERIRALESIDFDWGATKTDLAIRSVRFQQLCEFKVQFGHYLVPQKYAANPKLGKWVSKQRTLYQWYQEGKSSPMTEEYIRELESIGFDWGTTKTDWSVRFQQLIEYKVQFGHCLVSKQYSAHPELRNWVLTQRRNYRLYQKGKPSPMTKERMRKLESIRFDGGTSKT